MWLTTFMRAMFPLSGTWFTAIGLAFFFHGCDLVCQGKLPSAYQGQRYPPFLADPPPYLSCSVTVIWRAKLTCNPIRPSSDSRHAHLLLAVLTIWENLSTFSIAPVKKSLGVSLIHFFSYLTNNPWANIVGCTPNICLECGHFLPPGLLWLQTHLPFLT